MNCDSSIKLCIAYYSIWGFHSILSLILYMEYLPLINVQFILAKVCAPIYIMKNHSMFCIVVPHVYPLFSCVLDLNFFSLSSFYFLTSCRIVFSYVHIQSISISKVIYHTVIALSSYIFLDSFMISIHVL